MHLCDHHDFLLLFMETKDLLYILSRTHIYILVFIYKNL